MGHYDDKTFEEWLVDAAWYAAGHPRQRYGQALFNYLTHRPDLFEQIRATERDPFYDNDRVASFLLWVKGNWGDG